ncbi:pyridoxamine 5'-phosphate oxidase family protein [Mycobacterium sp. TNTM28]|uniref:Pyridoxamine 5'-phosphate oxidase family protein n=1 Tax=[Mycobacterium] fortunisiensis TaxID=2600579 RepID=A0ABS6KHB4_9MYCO|nr:pyridoxamine 5'-phosphate oxidase family protein [[Mycobacterium] fortunisiensis]MBU9762920.1 pyridoxamine 5'-phosphate oxidase family protein [[Mycobacterium] fortunisiensis]
MSVKVDLNQLADKLTDYTFAYLVTVDDSYHAHTVTVEPHLVDGVIDVGPVGGHTRRNLAAHEDVTLVWPPSSPGGYSLIVDGRGQAGKSDEDTHHIVPSRAVLHRKASRPGPTGPAGSCESDCIVLSEN